MDKFQAVLSVILMVLIIASGISAAVHGSVTVSSYICMCVIALLHIVLPIIERFM